MFVVLTHLVVISHCYGALKGHPRLEDKRWVSDKSESKIFVCSFSNLGITLS